jgi:hypothetical protein
MDTVIVIDNVKTNEYFFTKDHCQPTVGENLVPVTYYMPYHIKPRPGFESGIIENKEGMKRYFEHCGQKEILNPDPIFQA